jgi:ribosome recycling factor
MSTLITKKKMGQIRRRTSEDFAERLSTLLQKITDQFVEKADALSEKKAAEIRSV